MQDDRHGPDFGENQACSIQLRTVSLLRVGDAMIPPEAPEVRETDLLGSCLHATKEGLKCQTHAHADVLEYLAMHEFQGGPDQLSHWKHGLRIVQAQGLAAPRSAYAPPYVRQASRCRPSGMLQAAMQWYVAGHW